MLNRSFYCKFLTLLLFSLCITSIESKIKRKSEKLLPIHSDVIEEVASKRLEKMLDETKFIAVLFYDFDSCENCRDILDELEKIDDDADRYGVEFVKNHDKASAKKYGANTLPALVYFRNRQPTVYKGDLMDEDKVLQWLTSMKSDRKEF